MPRTPVRSRTASARAPRTAAPPVLVEVHRGRVVESRHRGQVVHVSQDGSVQHVLGDPDVMVHLRSSVKPFGLVALVESGAADEFALSPPELAVMAGSHSGEDLHVRTLQAVFRRAMLSPALLRCGSAMPLDEITATRLCRDSEKPGPLRHMCAGFHTASLLLSKHADWSLEDYDAPTHPSQLAARDAVARVFGVDPDDVVTAIDACGLPTYAFPLRSIAKAFAALADPGGADPPLPAATADALVRIGDAMMAAPEMVGGTRDRLDTAMMKARPGRLLAKGGAEGLLGVAMLAGARGEGSPPAGLALKVEDGDNAGRASRAAGVEALMQLGVLDEEALQRLAPFHRPGAFAPDGTQVGEAVPGFGLAPLGELT